MADAFPKGVAKPAIRALASIGVTRVEEAAAHPQAKLAALHGMGPKALEAIRLALAAQGKTFAPD